MVPCVSVCVPVYEASGHMFLIHPKPYLYFLGLNGVTAARDVVSDVCDTCKIGGVEISSSSLMFTDISLADHNSVTIYILFAFDSYLQLFALFI